VTRAGAIVWFAQHEGRLAWRDLSRLVSAGGRRPGFGVALGVVGVALVLHGFAFLMFFRADLASPPDRRMLVLLTGVLALNGSLMLSQAMELVTRGFYGRGDLDLILSSPVAAWRLFAVRIAAMVVTIGSTSLALAAPFINIAAWFGGMRWLSAYAVVAALAMVAVAAAVTLTAALFRAVGPKRTRLGVQIVAAVIGASFVIGVQFAAILSLGAPSQIVFLQSEAVVRSVPDIGSALWWLARAVRGDLPALAVMIGFGSTLLAIAIWVFAPRFGRFALATAGVAPDPTRQNRRSSGVGAASPAQALRRKEWTLLRRDPWLVSQSLMQLLYLLPPALMLWLSFYQGSGVSALLVPVLIIAAGQLAGSLAWLAISGEDVPDLIASAPVTNARVLRSKTEAVLVVIAGIFAPFIVALAAVAPISAHVTSAGVVAATASAASIQFWFRAQAKRSHFRRRHTSSRIATFAEALSSFNWGGAGALAVASNWLAVIPGLFAFAIVAGAWIISPARSAKRRERRRRRALRGLRPMGDDLGAREPSGLSRR
jgi:ABC-2 type transport system permease protein